MPVEIQPYLDDHGWRRAGAPEQYQALGGFFEQDVQSCVTSCDELLSILARIEQGEAPSWEGTGNAFTLTLAPHGASIRCEFADEYCALSLAELRAAIKAWRDVIHPSESTNVA